MYDTTKWRQKKDTDIIVPGDAYWAKDGSFGEPRLLSRNWHYNKFACDVIAVTFGSCVVLGPIKTYKTRSEPLPLP